MWLMGASVPAKVVPKPSSRQITARCRTGAGRSSHARSRMKEVTGMLVSIFSARPPSLPNANARVEESVNDIRAKVREDEHRNHDHAARLDQNQVAALDAVNEQSTQSRIAED